jgi:flagellar biosynthesis/type III secretory pathway chaperone
VSVNSIIEKLEKLVDMHNQLIQLSLDKTTIVKNGEVDKLQPLLVIERKLVQQLEKAEEARKKDVDEWFASRGLPQEDATITNMLNHLQDEEEQNALETSAVRLMEAIIALKQQEQLNIALIQQSMQFVQLSMDLLSPSLTSINYGNKTNADKSSVNRSIFDSKA